MTIRNEKLNDFHALFKEYLNFRLILVNGTKAFAVFKKHISFEVLKNQSYKKSAINPIPGKHIKSFGEKLDELM